MLGRPSDYTAELAEEICAKIIDGLSLRSICLAEGMPSARTVHRWLASNEMFRQQYARAKDEQADILADEILDIADDGSNDWIERKRLDGSTELVCDHEHIQRSRLRVDTRKWIASKLKPKKYGERMAHTDAEGNNLPPAVVRIEMVKP